MVYVCVVDVTYSMCYVCLAVVLELCFCHM